MSDRTAIDYVDATWSPVAGCTPVSAGCQHCFAARYAGRRLGPFADLRRPGRLARRRPFSTVQCRDDQLDVPLHWRQPRTILVPTLGDLFHEHVPDAFLDRVFAVMALANQHRYLVLTKRPGRLRSWLTDTHREAVRAAGEQLRPSAPPRHGYHVSDWSLRLTPWPPAHIWLGVSVEDQATADARIPILLQTPAAYRWVSVEPLLGPVDLRAPAKGWLDQTLGPAPHERPAGADPLVLLQRPRLDWAIVGGETGPRARVCRVEWITAFVAQVRAAGVPVWLKSFGRQVEADRVSDWHVVRVHERPAALEVGRG